MEVMGGSDMKIMMIIDFTRLVIASDLGFTSFNSIQNRNTTPMHIKGKVQAMIILTKTG